MRYSNSQIVLQEVPDEITLALSISGCPIRCKGCHSSETWKPGFGKVLNKQELLRLIEANEGISCVLFYGGEWYKNELIAFLKYVKNLNLKTCLYTGLELTEIDNSIIMELDYIKVGRYIEKLGGLSSDTTNQQFLVLGKKEAINEII